MLSAIAAWVWLRHPHRARRLRALEPMVPVDILAICVLQFLSIGSYLVLALLAFLPFFIATQAGRRAAVMSVAAILGGAVAVVSDPVFREQMSTLAIVTLLVMLTLLCLCSYTVSRVQQRRLAEHRRADGEPFASAGRRDDRRGARTPYRRRGPARRCAADRTRGQTGSATSDPALR